MASDDFPISGPDFALGVAATDVKDGEMLLGHAYGEPMILVRRGSELFAVGAVCTHWNGPLDEGLLVDDTVRCPWHHAAFSLRTGEAVRAPALKPVSTWQVDEDDGRIYVRDRAPDTAPPAPAATTGTPRSIVIIGGGAAGSAAAAIGSTNGIR